MAKYLYTAVLEPEDGLYNVTFPDLEDCYTCGDNLLDALKMAEDVLESYLAWHEDHGQEIHAATEPREVTVPNGCTSTLIVADTDHYRRLLSNKSVKKTLSIPEWMDEKARAKGLNFSRVLQDALERELATV